MFNEMYIRVTLSLPLSSPPLVSLNPVLSPPPSPTQPITAYLWLCAALFFVFFLSSVLRDIDFIDV